MTPEPITIPLAGGEFLAGEYRPGGAPRSAFAVLWAHGFGSHRGGEKAAAVAAECARRNWAFAAFDFRGHGASAGTMHALRASGLQADLTAIRHFLAGRGHPRLGLVGSSMGGFAAAWFARQNPEAAVGCVFLAPAFGFLKRRWDRLTEADRAEWERTDRLRVRNEWVDTDIGYGLVGERDRFRPEDLAAGWRTPTLIFHGVADDVVPDSDSLDFLRRAGYPQVELRLLKDGDHRLTAYKDEIASEAGRFFARLLGPGP
ncbi:MAG: Alpha/beta hydrolase family protein [Gemmataceae bacterium]|nr:Alpha/beta hydrolase family protein [Gemmataceae bacterium]